MTLRRIRHRRTAAGLLVAALVGATALGGGPATAVPPGFETTMLDKTASGVQSFGGPSTSPAVTRTALLVAFQSKAINLVINDTNESTDIFVKHRNTGSLICASVSSAGVLGNFASALPDIDSSGAYVVYESNATNLVGGDTNGVRDVFLHDTVTRATTRISRTAIGGQANGSSGDPAISDNGRYVAFISQASNLVPGDTNGVGDIFVADRDTGAVTRVSVGTGGVQGDAISSHASISGDGRYVAFTSQATNLVAGDTNGTRDVFVHDRQTGETRRVSVRGDGGQASGGSEQPDIVLRADGYVVAYTSFATDLVANDTNGVSDVFVFRSDPQSTVRASVSGTGAQGNGSSSHAALSHPSSGTQYVAFDSDATNLVAGDSNANTDVFRFDLSAGATVRFSVATGGGQATSATGGATRPAIDHAGHRITYTSDFRDLVPDDTVSTHNIFQTVDHGG